MPLDAAASLAKRSLPLVLAALLASTPCLLPSPGSAATPHPLGAPDLFFETNLGQFPDEVRYLARGPGYHVLISDAGVVYELGPLDGEDRIRVVPWGGRAPRELEASQPLPGTIHYYRGDDPARWIRGAATWGRVRLREVWDGIDLVYRAHGGRAEYDFVLAPGADPIRIELEFEGADAVTIDPEGRLLIRAGDGVLRTAPPVAFQGARGARRPVEAAFERRDGGRIGFRIGAWDPARELVIDPVILDYATSLGGSQADRPTGLAVAADGTIYVSGQTRSSDFQGGGTPPFKGATDIFVSRISADGSQLLFTTFYGGTNDETPHDLDVDAAGNAFVVMDTTSGDLPMVNAFDASFEGGSDYALIRVSSAGALAYSTYYGGAGAEGMVDGGVAVAPNGDVYITGRTASVPPNGIDLENEFQAACTALCAFVAGFDTDLSGPGSQVYGSYVGGNADDGGQDIDIDASGRLHVFGFTTSTTGLVDAAQAFQSVTNNGADQDNFLVVLDTALSGAAQRVYSTYIGSPGAETEPRGGIFVASPSAVFTTGGTDGAADTTFPYTAGFPIKNAVQATPGGGSDAYLTKIDTTTTGAASLVFSTFIGAAGGDNGADVETDSSGSIHLVLDGSAAIPTIAQPAELSAFTSANWIQLDATGQTLENAVALPSVKRVAIDASDRVLVTGGTMASFPEVGPLPASPAGGIEVFLARFDTLPLSGATLEVDATTQVPGVNDPFAYVFTLTNNDTAPITDFTISGSFPGGLSTVASALCFSSITCQPADPGDFSGLNAILSNERLTLFVRASSASTGSFDVSSLTATTTPADPDPSDNSDGVDVDVVTTPPPFNALRIADFDAFGLSSDIGGFAVDTPAGVLATSNGVLDDAANFMVFDGGFPVFVSDVYSRGILAIGFVERTTWTPSSGDGISLLDLDGGFGTVDRVYAAIELIGRGPVARVQLRSGDAFGASVLVPGQEAEVGLDPSRSFSVSVDPGAQTASVSYDGQVILSGNPFSTVLTGGADPGDLGDDMVISTGGGRVDLGGALFSDRALDSDRDGLADVLEVSACPSATDADSDDDGLSDGAEDANGNGVVDPGETDPCDPDTDGDGVQDGTELGVTSGVVDPDGASGPLTGTDSGVFVPDADAGTTTDPLDPDSDDDGFDDGDEDTNGNGAVDPGESDPLDQGSVPTSVPALGVFGFAAAALGMAISGSLALRRRSRSVRPT